MLVWTPEQEASAERLLKQVEEKIVPADILVLGLARALRHAVDVLNRGEVSHS